MSKTITNITLKFDKLYRDTGRAILVLYCNKEHWIPRKLCRNLVVNKKLGGHVSIPTFFYEKMGYTASDEIADTIVEHHVPEKLTPQNTNPDGELTR
jgi:hypothetical protein